MTQSRSYVSKPPVVILAILGLLAPVILSSSAAGQEMTCKQLLAQCGDGPFRQTNDSGLTSSVGGGMISNQCIGIISGVLAAYQFCHGSLSWAGAAAVLIHKVHADPKLMAMSGWECTESAYAAAFPCEQK
jgi:hypothetical protein